MAFAQTTSRAFSEWTHRLSFLCRLPFLSILNISGCFSKRLRGRSSFIACSSYSTSSPSLSQSFRNPLPMSTSGSQRMVRILRPRPVVSRPIKLVDTSIFRAAAFIGKEQASPVVSATYLVGRHPSLPVLSISMAPDDFLDMHLSQSVATEQQFQYLPGTG